MRFVKVALKCHIAVVLVDVDLPYWTSKVEHLVAFLATISNICTAPVHKRLFMHFRCKFRHCRSIRRPRFPIRVQNFGDLTPTSIISTKFEVDLTIHCRVLAFLSADTSRDFVTLTFDLLIINSCCAWRVLLQSLKTLCLSVLDLPLRLRTRPQRMRRITWPVSRRSKAITFLESPTMICPFTMNHRLLYNYNECN